MRRIIMQHMLTGVACLINIFSIFLSAEVKEIWSFQEVREELMTLPDGALVVFDVDDVLILYEDMALRRQAKSFVMDWVKNNCLDRQPDRLNFLKSAIMLQSKRYVLESCSIDIINHLKQQAKVIALTATMTGQCGLIRSVPDWRIADLQQLGFSFKQSFPNVSTLNIPMKDSSFRLSENFIVFKDGVLFSADYQKGIALMALLDTLRYRPTAVYFFDDDLRNVHSVEQILNYHHIPVVSIHYRASDLRFSWHDEECVLFQLEHLRKYGIWLSDEVVKRKFHSLKGTR